MRRVASYIVLILLFVSLLDHTANSATHNNDDRSPLRGADPTSEVGPVRPPHMIDFPWDLIFSAEISQTLEDQYIVGAEFVDNHFYVTGGNNTIDPNQVYVLDDFGQLEFQFDQWSSPGWGWRDLTYDGAYIYGSDDEIIDAFDPEGNPVPEMNFAGPLSPNRALAYDPVTDHFWTASFSSPLYEFDRDGNIIWSDSTGLTGVYGLAWDDGSVDAPHLWLFDQSGTPQTTYYQFDPIHHRFTSVIYNMPNLPGSTDQIAGGLFCTGQWDVNDWVLGGITQGTPYDQVFIIEIIDEIHTASIDITLVPLYSPILIPASGGSFQFYILVDNQPPPQTVGQMWCEYIPPDSTNPTFLKRPVRMIFDPVPMAWYKVQDVPTRAPSGVYSYIVTIGIYPDQYWKADTLYLEKLTTGEGPVINSWDSHTSPVSPENIRTGELVTQAARSVSIFPNPFNFSTAIRYRLVENCFVHLSVYDISGREVAELVNDWQIAGVHEAIFDGAEMVSGVYVYILDAGELRAKGKMVLMK